MNQPDPTRAPGPSPLELLRLLPGLRDNPLRFLQQVTEQYGDLVHFRLGPFNAFVLNRPEDIQHVLQDNNRNYTKDTLQYNALAEVTGRGLLTNDGESWLRQRRRMQPAFHRQHIQGFGPLMSAAAARMVDRWQEACERETAIDVDREMMTLALEILGRSLLGVDLREEAPALTSAVLVALDHTVDGLKRPNPLPRAIPTPGRRRFQQAMRTLDQAVQEIILAHRGAGPQAGGSDLLSTLLRETGDTPMTDRQVRDEIITLLIAGHETVASALTWACYLLSQNPSVEERLHEELARVLNGRTPMVEDLPALAYTRRVFDEALRLYPPAWLVTRKALEADWLSGVLIPPGSMIVVSIATAQRSPACWLDPQRFNPDRFLPEVSSTRPRFAYLPFGGGPRLCIGNHFALTEAPLILAAIYQRCHLALEPGRDVIVDPLVTLRPRGGLPMYVTLNQAACSEKKAL